MQTLTEASLPNLFKAIEALEKPRRMCHDFAENRKNGSMLIRRRVGRQY